MMSVDARRTGVVAHQAGTDQDPGDLRRRRRHERLARHPRRPVDDGARGVLRLTSPRFGRLPSVTSTESHTRCPREPVRVGRPDRRRRLAGDAASSASVSVGSRCRRSPSSPTPRRSTTPSKVGDADPQGADARNLWRVHWYNDLAGRPRRRARPRRAAAGADRRREPDHRRVRRPLPDDHGAQGARRLRLPRPADRHRSVRPDPPPGDLAVDRQLRQRRHRHQPDHGQPRRGDPARGHEPGALRLAQPRGARTPTTT